MPDPTEMPLLDRFVCFRAIHAEWRLSEFLTKTGDRILLSFSSVVYQDLIECFAKRSNRFALIMVGQ
jgi:hypothetical protein